MADPTPRGLIREITKDLTRDSAGDRTTRDSSPTKTIDETHNESTIGSHSSLRTPIELCLNEAERKEADYGFMKETPRTLIRDITKNSFLRKPMERIVETPNVVEKTDNVNHVVEDVGEKQDTVNHFVKDVAETPRGFIRGFIASVPTPKDAYNEEVTLREKAACNDDSTFNKKDTYNEPLVIQAGDDSGSEDDDGFFASTNAVDESDVEEEYTTLPSRIAENKREFGLISKSNEENVFRILEDNLSEYTRATPKFRRQSLATPPASRTIKPAETPSVLPPTTLLESSALKPRRMPNANKPSLPPLFPTTKPKSKKTRTTTNESDSCLPESLVKRLWMNLLKNSNSVATKDSHQAVFEATCSFFEQSTIDITAFAEHAERNTLLPEDVILLMNRQRIVDGLPSARRLIRNCLPREYAEDALEVIGNNEN